MSADVVPYRDLKENRAAIILIHGFNSDAVSAWGKFANIIQQKSSLSGWDVYGFSYHTGLAPDIRGIWQGD